MTCPTCHNEAKANGYDRKGNQRYYCRDCRKTFGEPRRKPLGNGREGRNDPSDAPRRK